MFIFISDVSNVHDAFVCVRVKVSVSVAISTRLIFYQGGDVTTGRLEVETSKKDKITRQR